MALAKKMTGTKTSQKQTNNTHKNRRKDGQPLTKSGLIAAIADETELSRRDVAAVFDSLTNIIRQHLGRQGAGTIALFGLMKLVRIHKPAEPARKRRNPFTGDEIMAKPKPARNVVKVRPLKLLKSMV